MEKNIKYFITIEKALSIFGKEILLLDDNLIIKSKNSDGTVNFGPILTLGNFSKEDVLIYARFGLTNKNQELLFEITPMESLRNRLGQSNVLTFEQVKNGSYYQLFSTFEKRTIKLIDFDTLKYMGSVPKNKYQIIVVLPSNIKEGKLYFSPNKNTILVNDNIKNRRKELENQGPGVDLYVYTEDLELLDEYRTWITEISEEEKNVFALSKKNYFFVRPLSWEEVKNLSKTESKMYRNLVSGATLATKNLNSGEILFEPSPFIGDEIELYNIKRNNLEGLLSNGVSNMPFKDLLEVYCYENGNLIPSSIDDALDIPRTFIKKTQSKTLRVSPFISKFHQFYKHDPSQPFPKFLKGGIPYEFELAGNNPQGNNIYKATQVIYRKETGREYAQFLNKNNRELFIKITGIPNENHILEKIKDLGLETEFATLPQPESISTNKNSRVTYYIEKSSVPNLGASSIRLN